jgi:NADH-quinone oxidoreductase subunit C
MPENHSAVIRLRKRFADSILAVGEFRGEVTITVAKEDIAGIWGTIS